MKKVNVDASNVAARVRALAKKMGGLAELARRMGLTRAAVKNYADGTRKPRLAHMGKLEELEGKRADRHPAPPAPAPPSPPARVNEKAPAVAQQEALVRDLDLLLQEALKDSDTSFRDRATVAEKKNSAIRTLAQLRGELEITEAQVVKSRAFVRVREAMTVALEPFPEAAAAVARALEELESTA